MNKRYNLLLPKQTDNLPCLFLLNPAEEDDIGFLILEANSPTTLSFSPRNVGSAWIPGEKDRPPAMSGLLVRDRSVRGLLGLPGGALPGSFAIILMIMIISCRLI